MRKALSMVLMLSLVLSVFMVGGGIASADTQYAWVLVDRYEYPIPEGYKPSDTMSYYADRTGNRIEMQMTQPYGLGPYASRDENNPVNIHAIYTWNNPPSVIMPEEMVTIKLNQEVLSNKDGNFSIGFKPYFNMDLADLNIGSATASKKMATIVYPDGSSPSNFKLGYGGDPQMQVSAEIDMTMKFVSTGNPGQKHALYFGIYGGGPGSIGIRYTYEWKEKPLIGAEAFESGIRIMWQPANGLGYRIYRSTSPDELGISVSDFYISGTSYADVNVLPNTSYYYTVKAVLAEANPLENIEEKLSAPLQTFTSKTTADMVASSKMRNFIMLKVDSPDMTVNGKNQEVDPGRGTTPVVLSSRTMVPIRAIVEAMGGTIEWEDATQKITINARGNVVEMWVGKTDLTINGTSQTMDVVPVVQNGRTFVPVRFAAENLNCKVDWINSTQEVVIVYED
ncbi:copper amine oxidase N-terminal domain-containing protein [Fusibacter tunisiensis]|uniref:Copper amine oxidase-like N-terminal domain-containing protein n=1 Tax=Fusibacter tunisiensis TaxID=1008308 RepID=A0ABS2MPW4_9FIRM|nr:stalk domain-containing protein [Fusibacter tunisiensis]MBM7561446.1 hypothetical protein [Fusibacter tunisiensis]